MSKWASFISIILILNFKSIFCTCPPNEWNFPSVPEDGEVENIYFNKTLGDLESKYTKIRMKKYGVFLE